MSEKPITFVKDPATIFIDKNNAVIVVPNDGVNRVAVRREDIEHFISLGKSIGIMSMDGLQGEHESIELAARVKITVDTYFKDES